MNTLVQKGAIAVALVALLWGVSPTVFASNDLDVTMRMVTDDDSLTESVVREIELPEPIGFERREGAARRNPADNARDARERGREFGQSAAERAREMRDLRGGGRRPEGEGRPDITNMPERPDVPGQGPP